MKPKDGLFAVGRRFTGLCLLCLMLLGGGNALANDEALISPPPRCRGAVVPDR